MKKLFLAGVLLGVLNFAQANSVSISTTATDLHGENAYAYLFSIAPLGANQTIGSADIVFNLTLTASGHNTFAYDLIDSSMKPANNVANTLVSISDNDAAGDYFTTLGLGSALTTLGTHSFPSVGSNWSTTYNFTTGTLGTLAALNTAMADGIFDLAFDPDCTYHGSITFDYTIVTKSVPDRAMTASLLGMSFLGLVALRRKLAFQ